MQMMRSTFIGLGLEVKSKLERRTKMERWREFYNKESKEIEIKIQQIPENFKLRGRAKIYHLGKKTGGLMIHIPLDKELTKRIYDNLPNT